jgi:hypothetical protein
MSTYSAGRIQPKIQPKIQTNPCTTDTTHQNSPTFNTIPLARFYLLTFANHGEKIPRNRFAKCNSHRRAGSANSLRRFGRVLGARGARSHTGISTLHGRLSTQRFIDVTARLSMGVLLQAFFKLSPQHAVPSPADGNPSTPWWGRRYCYFFRAIEAASTLACLFHPWNREKSPAFHASRSPGVPRSQSGRISLVTARRSCQRSMTDGRPQNQ